MPFANPPSLLMGFSSMVVASISTLPVSAYADSCVMPEG